MLASDSALGAHGTLTRRSCDDRSIHHRTRLSVGHASLHPCEQDQGRARRKVCIPYRIENLPPGHLWKKPPEMVARHPLGKVPYVEDGELTIYDSSVIDEYLEERFSWPRLMPPGDAIARAK